MGATVRKGLAREFDPNEKEGTVATRVVTSGPGLVRVRAESVDLARSLAEDIADDMRRYVPVLTGALRQSIRTGDIADGARITAGDTATGVDYHLYIEYGTSRMAAQPYIRPAVYRRRG